jgi:hypothetical protein
MRRRTDNPDSSSGSRHGGDDPTAAARLEFQQLHMLWQFINPDATCDRWLNPLG